ncbi:MAG: putative bifunctional diguanylate cyclase/phosphodiesterase, partial [Acidobacteriota bacterium]
MLAVYALMAVSLALYYLPLVSYSTLVDLITLWADPVWILLAIAAFQYRRSKLSPEERSFWSLMTASFVCFSGGTWLQWVVPGPEWGLVETVSADVLYMLNAIFMFLALSLNPHLDEPHWSLTHTRFRLESMGTIAFASLVLFYFVIIPIYYARPGVYEGNVPSMSMYIALDALVVFSFLYAGSQCASGRWKAVYRLLGIAVAFWLISDVVELAIYTDLIPNGIPYGTIYDFIWWVPFGAAIAAARIGRDDRFRDADEHSRTQTRRGRQLRFLFGPLVVYTASLPLVHFGLAALGGLDPSTREPREATVFFGILLLGCLALVNEKLVDRQRRKVERENKRLAAFPIKNPNPFLTFSPEGELKFLNPAASRTMRELDIDSIDEFLPPRHGTLVSQCMATRSGFRDIEVEIKDRVLSFGYYPNPSGDDVFVFVMDITERKKAEGQLKYDALHDTLTGLPNRTLVMEILSRAIDRAKRNPAYRFAVLFLDLDRFKVVNDSLGHLAGDRFLVEIGKRLARCLRSNDVVGRFGGDEFVIVVDDIRSVSQATRTAERIQQALGEPLTVDGQEIVTTACMGIAMSDSSRTRPEDYLRDADNAMYRAKSRRLPGFEVFDHEMHEEAVSLLKLENELRQALDRDQLSLYYQPYVDLRSSHIVGFEGLLRWHHPEVGLVRPDRFIPLAEDTGLIVPIGWWVIEQACARLERWSRMVPADAEFTVSVNVSSKQLRERGFAEHLESILERFDISRDELCLEITESVMTDLGDRGIRLLHDLRELGVQLTVDDFGTGYSSLSYLRQLPVDGLKIDRAFIANIEECREDVEIVRAINTLARNLELHAVAEGVETRGQANLLRQLGCGVA